MCVLGRVYKRIAGVVIALGVVSSVHANDEVSTKIEIGYSPNSTTGAVALVANSFEQEFTIHENSINYWAGIAPGILKEYQAAKTKRDTFDTSRSYEEVEALEELVGTKFEACYTVTSHLRTSLKKLKTTYVRMTTGWKEDKKSNSSFTTRFNSASQKVEPFKDKCRGE